MGGYGGYGGYGMGGYGGYGVGGFGKGFWSPYGFSNYGPRPHGQPQGYGQQPPTDGQQPEPTDPTQDGQTQEQPAVYQPPQQPVFAQQSAYQQPGYPRAPAYGHQQSSYPQGAAW